MLTETMECKSGNSEHMKSWLPQPEGKHSGVFLQAELHHLSTEAGESSKRDTGTMWRYGQRRKVTATSQLRLKNGNRRSSEANKMCFIKTKGFLRLNQKKKKNITRREVQQKKANICMYPIPASSCTRIISNTKEKTVQGKKKIPTRASAAG